MVNMWCLRYNHMIKSSSNGRLKGSLMIPQAKSRDTIHIGSIHWSVNIKTGFPATLSIIPLWQEGRELLSTITFQERKLNLPEERSLDSVRSTNISPTSRSVFSSFPSNLLAWPRRSSSNTVFISISLSEQNNKQLSNIVTCPRLCKFMCSTLQNHDMIQRQMLARSELLMASSHAVASVIVADFHSRSFGWFLSVSL